MKSAMLMSWLPHSRKCMIILRIGFGECPASYRIQLAFFDSQPHHPPFLIQWIRFNQGNIPNHFFKRVCPSFFQPQRTPCGRRAAFQPAGLIFPLLSPKFSARSRFCIFASRMCEGPCSFATSVLVLGLPTFGLGSSQKGSIAT